jgi:uncharacterized surface protein with fasciclin (FAS1) repeats
LRLYLRKQKASNGVVHRIDGALLPPESVVETIQSAPAYFSRFLEGLEKSDLLSVVNDTSTHVGSTVFAPSNIAFEKLDHDVQSFLFSEQGAKHLKALLKYHIVLNHTLYSDAQYDGKVERPTNPEDHPYVSFLVIVLDYSHQNPDPCI